MSFPPTRLPLTAFGWRPHHRAHLAPVASILGARTYEAPGVVGPEDIALIASYGDLARARRAGFRRKVLMQHGAGQSYGGDRRTAWHPAYPGGSDNDDVGLFLVPNHQAAERWREAYPEAAVEVVGCPRLDGLATRAPGMAEAATGSARPVVAFSFHWNYHGIPEMRSAFDWYRDALAHFDHGELDVIGHAHPKRRDLAAWYADHGIEYEPHFEEVLRRADVYVVDNSSTLFEFAVRGPVVVLNAPWYRRDARHGLRFWDAAGIGPNVDTPEELTPAILRALEDGPASRMARHAVLANVYPYRGSSAERAARAIERWGAA